MSDPTNVHLDDGPLTRVSGEDGAGQRRVGSSDAACISRSLDTPELFAEIFDRHWTAIYRFCTARAGAEGEDIAAEVFRIAFSKRQHYQDDRQSALPWLYGIATNKLRHRNRSTARRLRAIERLRGRAEVAFNSATVVDPSQQIVNDLSDTDEISAALAAIDRLPTPDREVLLLAAWTDLTYEGMSVALGIPVGTVRSRLSRARRRLRAEIGAGNV